MPKTKFEDLPEDWQRKVRKLRSDCARYRAALRAAEHRLTECNAAAK